MVTGVDELSRKFIERLRTRNRIDLTRYDTERWFAGAYSTMQRTLRGTTQPLSREAKIACMGRVFQAIPAIRSGEFDRAIENLIKGLSESNGISIGQSQKLVSILCKYAFAHVHAGLKALPPEWSAFVAAHEQAIVVPIDAVVLYWLNQRHPAVFGDIRASDFRRRGSEERGYAARLVGAGGSEFPWSRIDSYPDYWFLQTRIRDIARQAGCAPLEYEMRFLWPQD